MAAERGHMRHDLALIWLQIGPGGGVIEARHCRRCQPGGPIRELTCTECDDGPLLAGDLAGDDPRALALLEQWLTRNNWQLKPPICGRCVAHTTAGGAA